MEMEVGRTVCWCLPVIRALGGNAYVIAHRRWGTYPVMDL